MEQVHLPSEAPQLNQTAPYHGTSDYLGVDFYTYARTSGYQVLLNRPMVPTWEHLRTKLGKSSADVERFLHTWLFCSLLQEVFAQADVPKGQVALYEHNDFILNQSFAMLEESSPTTSINAVFCTSKLIDKLETWLSELKEVAKEPAAAILKRLENCLEIVSYVLWIEGSELNSHVKQIIASTGGSVSIALNKASRQSGLSIYRALNLDWAGHGWTKVDKDRMISLGWCPFEVHRFDIRQKDLSTLLYYSCMPRRNQLAHHVSCSVNECSAFKHVQLPQHRKEPCDCGEIFRLGEELQQRAESILSCDEIFVLELSTSKKELDFSIDVVSWTDPTPYTALSHVWTDGLGNPDENALHLCQLRHVYDCIVKTGFYYETSEKVSVRVWIDTICCPAKPLDKKGKVLSFMQAIYEKADRVVVLDAELESTCVKNMDRLEVAARTLNSRWMQRLWTLQEGFLARKLYFLYADATWEMDDLLNFDMELVGLGRQWIAYSVKTDLNWGLRRRILEESATRRDEVGFLATALRNRKVTNATDEPLCLATLLQLEPTLVKKMLPLTGEERMAELWRALGRRECGISKAFLFHHGVKLKADGLKWAPLSLLDAHLTMIGSAASGSIEHAGRVTETGFLVASGGITLQSSRTDDVLYTLWRLEKLRSKFEDVCHLRDSGGRWYSLSQPPPRITEAASTPTLASEGSNVTPTQTEKEEIAIRDLVAARVGTPKRIGVLFSHSPMGARLALMGILVDISSVAETVYRAEVCGTVAFQEEHVGMAKVFELAYQTCEKIKSTSENYTSYLAASLSLDSEPVQIPRSDLENVAGLANEVKDAAAEALAGQPALESFISAQFPNVSATHYMLFTVLLMFVDCFHINIAFLPKAQQWSIA